jgi:hypothetical protein
MGVFSWSNEKANFLRAYHQVPEEERLASNLRPLDQREARIAAAGVDGRDRDLIGRIFHAPNN